MVHYFSYYNIGDENIDPIKSINISLIASAAALSFFESYPP